MKAQQTAPMTPVAAKPSNESGGPPSLATCEAESRTKADKALAESARTVGPSKAYCCEDGTYEREITR